MRILTIFIVVIFAATSAGLAYDSIMNNFYEEQIDYIQQKHQEDMKKSIKNQTDNIFYEDAINDLIRKYQEAMKKSFKSQTDNKFYEDMINDLIRKKEEAERDNIKAKSENRFAAIYEEFFQKIIAKNDSLTKQILELELEIARQDDALIGREHIRRLGKRIDSLLIIIYDLEEKIAYMQSIDLQSARKLTLAGILHNNTDNSAMPINFGVEASYFLLEKKVISLEAIGAIEWQSLNNFDHNGNYFSMNIGMQLGITFLNYKDSKWKIDIHGAYARNNFIANHAEGNMIFSNTSYNGSAGISYWPSFNIGLSAGMRYCFTDKQHSENILLNNNSLFFKFKWRI